MSDTIPVRQSRSDHVGIANCLHLYLKRYDKKNNKNNDFSSGNKGIARVGLDKTFIQYEFNLICDGNCLGKLESMVSVSRALFPLESVSPLPSCAKRHQYKAELTLSPPLYVKTLETAITAIKGWHLRTFPLCFNEHLLTSHEISYELTHDVPRNIIIIYLD